MADLTFLTLASMGYVLEFTFYSSISHFCSDFPNVLDLFSLQCVNCEILFYLGLYLSVSFSPLIDP